MNLKVSPLPWEFDNIQLREDRSAYTQVYDANGKKIFDTCNSDVAVIFEEEGQRWDGQGELDLGFAVHAANCHLELRIALEAALEDLMEVPGRRPMQSIEIIEAALKKANAVKL